MCSSGRPIDRGSRATGRLDAYAGGLRSRDTHPGKPDRKTKARRSGPVVLCCCTDSRGENSRRENAHPENGAAVSCAPAGAASHPQNAQNPLPLDSGRGSHRPSRRGNPFPLICPRRVHNRRRGRRWHLSRRAVGTAARGCQGVIGPEPSTLLDEHETNVAPGKTNLRGAGVDP